MNRSPVLDGLIVAERGGRLAAAVATTLLGGLGATVLRLEADAGRPHSDPAAWHTHPIALGGKTRVRAGHDPDADWRALSRGAHVAFVSSVVAGAAAGDAASASAAASDIPALVSAHTPLSSARLTVALTAFGLDAADAAASELAVQAVSGSMATTGRADGPPCAVRAPLLEMLAGVNAATSTLAALRVGTHKATLDLALLDSALALAGTFHAQALANPARLFRDGAQHPLCAPWNAYRTSDGWVTLCIASDHQWRRCATLITRPDLGADPALATSPQRVAARQRLDAAVSAWTSKRPLIDVVRLLREAGLPVSAVVEAGPATCAAFASLVTAGQGATFDVPGPPLWLSATPLRPRRQIASPVAAGKVSSARAREWRKPAASSSPLQGIRVVEIGPYTAGPLAGRYLADLGAEVIKVEPPGGENSRGWQPRVGHASGYFANYNCGKRSVTLELDTAQGAARMRELVGGADVLLQNLKPNALARLDLDPVRLARENPRLIVCSISGYGRNAPPLAALDTVVQAGSGLMSLIARPDSPTDVQSNAQGNTGSEAGPVKTGFSYGDLTAAHIAAFGVVAAIVERDASGLGQAIDVPMHDALVWLAQLGWPGIATPSFSVSRHGDNWMLEVDGEPARPVCNVAVAVTSAIARRRSALRTVDPGDGGDSGDSGGWKVLAAPHRWRAATPDAGRHVACAGEDNAELFDTSSAQPALT